ISSRLWKAISGKIEVTWQSIVLALGQVVFIIALLPSMLTKDKPEIWTSVLTGLVALSISITYLTLHIRLASIMAFLNFVAWAILAVQKLRQSKHRNKIQKQGEK
ncbi:MAG: hypothetical protein ACREGF_00760, partial [Candidatus Saccharimonadales bacterium]